MRIIALHSHRARQRVTATLHRDLGYVWLWRTRGPKAGYAEVTEEEFQRVRHLPGVTQAQPPKGLPPQLPLL